MNELMLIGIFIGNLTLTSYRSVPEQTDDSPYWTSIGERVNSHGAAVSQDLLKSGVVRYGDLLYIEGQGFKIVNDCMNKRLKNSVDVWVETKPEEHAVGKRKARVWIVRRKI